MNRNQPFKENSMCEGFKTGRDCTHLSNRKKTREESLREREVRQEAGTVGSSQIWEGLWPLGRFGFLSKEHWEVLKGFKQVRGDIL